MKRQERIYEKKEPKTKSRTICIRVDEEMDAWIRQQSKDGGITPNEFIRKACQNTTIKVIPEGKQISKDIHEIRNTLVGYPLNVNTEEINIALSKILVNLRKLISSEA